MLHVKERTNPLYAVSGAAVMTWRTDMENAPRDRRIRIRTRKGNEVCVRWQEGFVDSEWRECGCWQASDDVYPECWTDGVCWETNEDGLPSDQPVMWAELLSSPTRREARDMTIHEELIALLDRHPDMVPENIHNNVLASIMLRAMSLFSTNVRLHEDEMERWRNISGQ